MVSVSGYPTGYKSSSSQSPYPSQPSSYPQPGSLSSQQQPVQYPSGQPNSNLPPVQHLDPNAPPGKSRRKTNTFLSY